MGQLANFGSTLWILYLGFLRLVAGPAGLAPCTVDRYTLGSLTPHQFVTKYLAVGESVIKCPSMHLH
jgi:hypothetical protein